MNGHERAALGRIPIPGAQPAGAALGEDAALDALREEVRRDPVHGVLPDWRRVETLATEILSSRCKDLVVACQLCVALAHQHRLAGLRDGLEIVLGVIECYWDTAQPPVPARAAARLKSLEWMVARCAAALRTLEIGAADRETLQQCRQASATLQKAMTERFADRAPSLTVLDAALHERLTTAVPAPAPKVARVESPERSVSGSSAATISDVELRTRSDVPLLLLKCTAYLRAKDPSSALAYCLPRLLRWAEIECDPPSRDGRLAIRGPAGEQLAALQTLSEQRRWAELLEAAEGAFWQLPLWLDLQRWSSAALEGLGHRNAAAAIHDQLASLLRRAPTLPGVCFEDGTSIADTPTRHWLGALSRSAVQPPATASAPTAPDTPLAAACERAHQLAECGDLDSALAFLASFSTTQRAGRARFEARLELALLCCERGEHRSAGLLFDELDAQIQSHGLETWEPELAARVLEAAYVCERRHAASAPNGTPSTAAAALARRLCRIDPLAARVLA